MVLTTKGIERLKRPGRHRDERGLYLKITPSGVKSWIFRYERGGRERWMGLGPLHVVSLKSARERARKAREQLLDNIDPIEARRAEKAAAAMAMTFAQCTQAYYEQHEGRWRNRKHRAQFLSTLATYAHPLIGSRSVASIDTPAVLRVLEQKVDAEPAGPLWTTRPETANRVRSRIEVVLDWAQVRGQRSGENPARWKGHLDQVLPAPTKRPEHHAAIAYTEISAFMSRLRDVPGAAARALEFTILTCVRSGEARGAKWDEIDFTTKTWIVPAARMKGGKEHSLPLSPAALDLLSDLGRERDNEYVFAGATPGSAIGAMGMMQVLKRLDPKLTVHGFRSAFSDWAHESTGFPNHIIEASLAHVVGNAVERAYRRGDLFEKRALLMQSWARYCSSTPVSGEVVPMRGAL